MGNQGAISRSTQHGQWLLPSKAVIALNLSAGPFHLEAVTRDWLRPGDRLCMH